MRDMNRMLILGRVGSVPERRETKNGVPVVHFSVATSRKAPGAVVGEGVPPVPATEAEITQWHRVIAWGRQAEHCAQYLRKGETVFIDGSFRTRTYTDNEKKERVAFEIHAEQVLFLGRRQKMDRPEVDASSQVAAMSSGAPSSEEAAA